MSRQRRRWREIAVPAVDSPDYAGGSEMSEAVYARRAACRRRLNAQGGYAVV